MIKHDLRSHGSNISKSINIDSKQPSSSNFQFATVYPWINSVTIKKFHGFTFTNKLKDQKDFASKIYNVLITLIPNIYKNSKGIFSSGGNVKHCHIITNTKKDKYRIDRLEKICFLLYGSRIEDSGYDRWWQVGIKGPTRIIGIYNGHKNIFYPLFCDWYHLIIPSPKYNYIDLTHLEFNPKVLKD